MQIDNHANSQDRMYADAEFDLKEIVMGLHWDPPQDGVVVDPEDLDALCMLLDAQCRVLEVIHPGHPRNANGSVMHTGDSLTGASGWDDERIFVFLEALPEVVSTLAFVVVSATGNAFSGIRGASCHISDRITEHEWVKHELTALGQYAVYCVATLSRSPTGWKISPDSRTVDGGLLTELLSLAGSMKGRGR